MAWSRECYVPKPSKVDFLGPYIGVEAFAPILIEDQCVGVIDNRTEAVVDEVPCDGNAQGEPDQRDDGDPFLPRVLGGLPRMINVTLLHPPRAEVLLVLFLVVDVDGRRVLGRAQGGCVERVSRGGIDVVTARVARSLNGATSVWGLLRCVIW